MLSSVGMLNGNGKLGWYWKLKCLSENGKFLDAGETHTEYNLQAENLNNKLPHDTCGAGSRGILRIGRS